MEHEEDVPLAPEPLAPPLLRNTNDILEGWAEGEPKPKGAAGFVGNIAASYRSPAMMMRQMGFCPNKHMSPLQFLMAVMNDRVDLVYRSEAKAKRINDKGGIGINYRIECAKTAAKYMHMEMPKIEIQQGEKGSFSKDLINRVVHGNERVQTRRMIIETVERISPDIEQQGASFPPAFDEQIVTLTSNTNQTEFATISDERSYNPDTDD